MPAKANHRFYKALLHEPQAIPPIWLMRQAGRYHQHYQALRKQYSFMELCKQPCLSAKVALGPIQDFDFDVAIVFSDLLFPLEGLGLGLSYQPEPILDKKLTSELLKKTASINQICDFLQFQGEAVRQTRKDLPSDKSLVGFVGGPWTLFMYATNGTYASTANEPLQANKSQETLFYAFCDKMLPVIEANISMQLNMGAEVVYIFDTAAGGLSNHLYEKWLAPSLGQLAKKFPQKIAYFTKGLSKNPDWHKIYQLPCFSHAPWAGFVYDNTWDLPALLKQKNSVKDSFTPNQERLSLGFTQGNFSPELLRQDPDTFKHNLDDAFIGPLLSLTPAQRTGWICSLGHGILPGTPEENVRHFVRHMREVFAN